MGPEARMEGLAAAPAQAREALADAILAGAVVRVAAGPEVATVAVRLPVPGTASTVVAGRAVVTTCEVVLDGVRGDGLVAGRAPREALSAAICDAEAERNGPLTGAVVELAASGTALRAGRAASDAAAVASTRIAGEGA